MYNSIVETPVNKKLRAKQSFYVIPEGVGAISTLDIGGKTIGQLLAETEGADRRIGGYALTISNDPTFTTLKKITPRKLLMLKVEDFDLGEMPQTSQIIERATHSRVGNKAIELCEPEVGLHLAIAHTDQPLGDHYYIIHKPLVDRDGAESILILRLYQTTKRA